MSKEVKWFKEILYEEVVQSIRIDEEIFRCTTEFQEMLIFYNHKFGRIMALDSIIQLAEIDEYIYHEAMAHSPIQLFIAKHGHEPKSICIIGGGDGGVLREVVKYKQIEKIVLIEIDPMVISASEKYLPDINNNSFSDPRLKIVNKDAFQTLDNYPAKIFDIIVVDSTDPIGPAKKLFTNRFYSLVESKLSDGGLAVFQSGSILLQPDEFTQGCQMLSNLFNQVKVQVISNATYYGGEFCLLLASKLKIDQIPEVSPRNFTTRWYSQDKLNASLVATPEIIKKIKISKE